MALPFLTGNLFFKHKGHDGHKGKPKESRLFFAFVYFVPFVVKLFPVNYGRPGTIQLLDYSTT
ncbi:MAG: hypothetical protein CNIPEHKO_02119 [Anaerolineales bacterium]|nr:hypothetical protein [Anaerolineales bacterium]